MAILVTGGAGYIGSHTVIELLSAGFDVIVVDNFSNSKPESLRRVERLAGKSIKIYEMDLLDRRNLQAVFADHSIDAVIHFAGLKAVGESVEQPLQYYHNNLTGTLILSEVMQAHGVKRMIFSSSATVYGKPDRLPITEDSPLSATNPYGRSKLMIEAMLQDLYRADQEWSLIILRYFNPIGAHPSGEIGEDPKGTPNNLVPFITKVAAGALKELAVFGNNYLTIDGTGVRDYIHIMDLASGHLKALEKALMTSGIRTYNLGTGKGYSVLEVISAFEKATGVKVPYRMTSPRPGDVDACFASSAKAERELDWRAERGIDDMCRDAWRWQMKHPNGFSGDLKAEAFNVTG